MAWMVIMMVLMKKMTVIMMEMMTIKDDEDNGDNDDDLAMLGTSVSLPVTAPSSSSSPSIPKQPLKFLVGWWVFLVILETLVNFHG